MKAKTKDLLELLKARVEKMKAKTKDRLELLAALVVVVAVVVFMVMVVPQAWAADLPDFRTLQRMIVTHCVATDVAPKEVEVCPEDGSECTKEVLVDGTPPIPDLGCEVFDTAVNAEIRGGDMITWPEKGSGAIGRMYYDAEMIVGTAIYWIGDLADATAYTKNGAMYEVRSRLLFEEGSVFAMEYPVRFIRRAPALQEVELPGGKTVVVPNYDKVTMFTVVRYQPGALLSYLLIYEAEVE